MQRATRDVGHCAFIPRDLVTAFTDLVKCVEAGVKPAGDNVLDAAEDAMPDFGCKWTDPSYPRLWDNPGLEFLAPAACPAP